MTGFVEPTVVQIFNPRDIVYEVVDHSILIELKRVHLTDLISSECLAGQNFYKFQLRGRSRGWIGFK